MDQFVTLENRTIFSIRESSRSFVRFRYEDVVDVLRPDLRVGEKICGNASKSVFADESAMEPSCPFSVNRPAQRSSMTAAAATMLRWPSGANSH